MAQKFSITITDLGHWDIDGTITDLGHWEIDGDRLCVQWSKWEGSNRWCRTTATRNGENLMFDAEGTVTSRQTIREGNPFKL